MLCDGCGLTLTAPITSDQSNKVTWTRGYFNFTQVKVEGVGYDLCDVCLPLFEDDTVLISERLVEGQFLHVDGFDPVAEDQRRHWDELWLAKKLGGDDV